MPRSNQGHREEVKCQGHTKVIARSERKQKRRKHAAIKLMPEISDS